MYSQTFLIRASLIRMPRNPNPLPGKPNLFDFLVIRMFHNPNTF